MFCSLEIGMNRNLLWKDGTVTEKVAGSEVVINWQTRALERASLGSLAAGVYSTTVQSDKH